MDATIKLVYAYDTLCGWCYGLIPALKHFTKERPHVEIEVLPGGLFVGEPARPYASLVAHIRSAERRLEAVTGRKPSDAFHRFIASDPKAYARSEVPGHALLQMNALDKSRSLEFAHLLQEAHFGEGKDLNEAQTYIDICDAHGFPALDIRALLKASLDDEILQKGFKACRDLRPQGYPTVFVVNESVRGKEVLGTIGAAYAPEQLVMAFDELARGATN